MEPGKPLPYRNIANLARWLARDPRAAAFKALHRAYRLRPEDAAIRQMYGEQLFLRHDPAAEAFLFPGAAGPAWSGRLVTPAEFASRAGVQTVVPSALNAPPAEPGRAMAFRCERPIVLGGSFALLPTSDQLMIEGMVHNPVRISGGRLDAEQGLVAADGHFLCRRRPVRAVEHGCFLLGDSTNYGHWLWNHFARLAYLDHLGIEAGRLKVLVGAPLSQARRDMLALAGIGPERIEAIAPDEAVAPAALWAPTMLWGGYPHGPDDACFLNGAASAFVRRFALDAGRPHRRLYLTRRNAAWRRLANEAEVATLLERHGFETIDPGALSFDEQRRLAAEASHIAGPFGAGMNFAAFAPVQATVIEFKLPDVEMDLAPVVCAAIGQRYCAVAATPAVPGQYALNADLLVDVAGLSALLRDVV